MYTSATHGWWLAEMRVLSEKDLYEECGEWRRLVVESSWCTSSGVHPLPIPLECKCSLLAVKQEILSFFTRHTVSIRFGTILSNESLSPSLSLWRMSNFPQFACETPPRLHTRASLLLNLKLCTALRFHSTAAPLIASPNQYNFQNANTARQSNTWSHKKLYGRNRAKRAGGYVTQHATSQGWKGGKCRRRNSVGCSR